jgi:membrane protein DedA with SNARE-associated domain
MSYWRFQVANFVSALVWSAALLLFGDVIGQVIEWIWRSV